MSDQEQSQNPGVVLPEEKKIFNVTFRCSRIAWDAFDCDYGHMEAACYDLDPRISARVDIWACAKSDANPDGYFLSLADPTKPYLGAEPGDLSNNKHLLCKIILRGVPEITSKLTQEEIDRNNNRSFHVEYYNHRLPPIKPEEILPPPVVIGDDVVIEEALLIGDEVPSGTKGEQ